MAEGTNSNLMLGLKKFKSTAPVAILKNGGHRLEQIKKWRSFKHSK